jgi:hypothetical protein
MNPESLQVIKAYLYDGEHDECGIPLVIVMSLCKMLRCSIVEIVPMVEHIREHRDELLIRLQGKEK